jgi:glycosyltransferase involved in cell wall biosynthesis
MTFAIITHVPHIIDNNDYFAYAPYVTEMDIWSAHMEVLVVVAPLVESKRTLIDLDYKHKNIEFVAVKPFDVLDMKAVLVTVLKLPQIGWKIYKVMRKADHIHLRCPGNMGLFGSFIQIAFPNKIKTAKYAGNWDSKSKQPWSYRLQKWIVSNTFLTRNMQVLVYGEWEGSSKNIKPFFTATYKESDKVLLIPKALCGVIHFIFVGTLVEGKKPMYAIELVEALSLKGFNVHLSYYGEGLERNKLEDYIAAHNLEEIVSLKGNQLPTTVREAYQNSHFVILPSESEGWPKAIAEGMFWGCVPLATAVSCVPFMLDHGQRGVLLDMDLEKDVEKTVVLLNNQVDFDSKRQKASDWSRNYTLDVFEEEIKELLKPASKFEN